MSAIHFVARDAVGQHQQGTVFDSPGDDHISLTSGGAISLNMRRLDVSGYLRQGDDLVLMLVDGRQILLEDYFGPDGAPQADLYLNEGGHLIAAEVSATGAVSHVDAEQWGKWGELSALTFPDDPVVLANTGLIDGTDTAVAAALGDGDAMGAAVMSQSDDTPTMLAGFGLAPLVGVGGAGTGLILGAGALGAAAVVGGAAGSGNSGGAGSGAGTASTGTGSAGSGGGASGGGTSGGSGGTGGGSGTGTSGSSIAPAIDGAGDSLRFNADSAKTVTITGRAEPGSEVEVTVGGATVTTRADGDGRWSAGFDGSDFPGDGSYRVGATVTEPDGTITRLDGQGIAVDTVPPDLAVDGYGGVAGTVINAVENGAGFSLVGTGEPGAQVSLTINGVAHQTTVSGAGHWTLDIASGTLPGGEYDVDVHITGTDDFGNARTVIHTLTLDTVAPDVALGAHQAGDNVINGAEAARGVEITGQAEPDARVEVTMNGVTYTTTASAAGLWSVSFASGDIPAGTYDAAVTVVATDAAGNSAATTGTVAVDTRVSGLASHGVVDNDGLVNAIEASDGITLTGTVEPGATISVSLGVVTRPASVDALGRWSVDFAATEVPAGEAGVPVVVVATDAAGNSAMVTDTVRVDTGVNRLSLDGPIGGDGYVNAAEAASGLTLTGTVEAGSTVLVDLDGTVRPASVDAAGNWTAVFTAAEVGSGEDTLAVTVLATDAAGNTRFLTDSVMLDTDAPDAAFVIAFDRAGDSLRGFTVDAEDAAAEITSVDLSGAQGSVDTALYESPVAPGEVYLHFPDALPDGAHLVLTKADAAGNSSATFIAQDKGLPDAIDLTNPGLAGHQIEAVDLRFAEDSILTIDSDLLEGLSDNSNTLTIHGSADDTVRIDTGNGAVLTDTMRSVTIGTEDYAVYTLGDEGGTLIIDEDILITT